MVNRRKLVSEISGHVVADSRSQNPRKRGTNYLVRRTHTGLNATRPFVAANSGQ